MKRKSSSKSQLIHISNNLIALIAVLATVVSLIVDYSVYQNAKSRLAGDVVSTGNVELCLNHRPDLSNCQITAAVGALYACNIDEDINQILTVSDNSSLFNAPSGGSINFTPASANVGFHAIGIDVSDNSGCANSDNTLLLNLTISGTTSTPSGGEAGSSAGGGGGGGGGIQLPTNETASENRRWDSISAREIINFVIDNINIAITNIMIDVINTLSNVDLKVARLMQNPTEVVPSAKVYQYLGITRNNLENSDASKITIIFKVTKNWLSENKVAEKDMVLYEFQNTRWKELNTNLIASDSNYAYYEAITPGFSTFAAVASNEPPLAEFAVDRDLIKVILKQYETKTSSFQIKNTANIEIDVSIDTDLGKYITFEDKIITLGPGEERWISFDAKVADEPGIYTGKISLISAYQKKEIKLVLEVHSVVSLFDVRVLVQKQYKQVGRGDTFTADISLVNIGDPTEAKLYYSVIGLDNQNVVSNEEVIYVKEPLIVSRELKLPENINLGKYLFYVKLTAGSNEAFATDIFEVVRAAKTPVRPLYIILAAIVVIVLLTVTYYNIHLYRGKVKKYKIVSSKQMEKLSIEKTKLQKQLDALLEAYNSGFVSKESHEKSRKKLDDHIKELNKIMMQ